MDLMKTFKIRYPINGEEIDIYAQLMDMKHRMYTIEREPVDPRPLLIERQDDGTWKVKSKDNWSMTNSEITKLGETLEREYPHHPPR